MTVSIGLRGFLLATLLVVCPVTLAAEPDVSPEKINALKMRIKETASWIEDAERERSDLQKNVRKLDRDLDQVSRELFQLETQQKALESEFEILRQREADIEAQSSALKESLSGQIRAVYAQGDAPALRLLLSGESPDEFSRALSQYHYLSDATLARINEFNRLRETLAGVREQQVAQQEKITSAAADLKERQAVLDAKLDERNKALKALQGELKDRKSQLANMEADRKRLEKVLQDVERALAETGLPPASAPFSKLKGKLPWPTPGKLVGSYGAPMADSALKRDGIVIRNSERTPVIAVHYGRVVFSDWLRGFGLLLIVDHGNGYMTLYGNNQSLLKSTGDKVRAGETVALTGTDSAADGPGLYFEIRHLGKPVDPQKWLAKSRKR